MRECALWASNCGVWRRSSRPCPNVYALAVGHAHTETGRQATQAGDAISEPVQPNGSSCSVVVGVSPCWSLFVPRWPRCTAGGRQSVSERIGAGARGRAGRGGSGRGRTAAASLRRRIVGCGWHAATGPIAIRDTGTFGRQGLAQSADDDTGTRMETLRQASNAVTAECTQQQGDDERGHGSVCKKEAIALRHVEGAKRNDGRRTVARERERKSRQRASEGGNAMGG